MMIDWNTEGELDSLCGWKETHRGGWHGGMREPPMMIDDPLRGTVAGLTVYGLTK